MLQTKWMERTGSLHGSLLAVCKWWNWSRENKIDKITEKSGIISSSTECVCVKLCNIPPAEKKAITHCKKVGLKSHHITWGHHALQGQGGGMWGRKFSELWHRRLGEPIHVEARLPVCMLNKYRWDWKQGGKTSPSGNTPSCSSVQILCFATIECLSISYLGFCPHNEL